MINDSRPTATRRGKSRGALFANNAFAEDIVVLTLTANMISADDRDAKRIVNTRVYIYTTCIMTMDRKCNGAQYTAYINISSALFIYLVFLSNYSSSKHQKNLVLSWPICNVITRYFYKCRWDYSRTLTVNRKLSKYF